MGKLFNKRGKAYKVMNFLSKITGIILCFATISLYIFILFLDIFPIKYLIGIGITSLIITGAILFILVSKRTKPKAKIAFTIISILIVSSIIWSIFSGFNTLHFFDKAKTQNYKTEKYYVIVRKDSSYNNIVDLNGINIYFYNNNSKSMDDVITNITEKIITTITKSNELLTITDDLLERKTKAIIMESSFKEILDEENETFKDNTKIIYTVKTKIKEEEVAKEVGITTEPFTFYISGMDAYGSITKTSRSDVNILVTINPITKQVLLTSIPRDYYVRLHGTRGYKDKLTHAGIYGINMSVRTIEDLLDVDVNYYARINFTTLTRLVDSLGGIDVNSKYAFKVWHYNYYVGNNHLNGDQALAFARERHSFPNGDRTRGENQETVIKEIVEKASNSQILSKYNTVINALSGTFETNISSKNIKKLVKMQINDMASWNIVSANLNGTDSSNYTYSMGKQMLYVMEPTQSTINHAKEMIAKVKNGEIITKESK